MKIFSSVENLFFLSSELIKRNLGHIVLDIFSHLDAGSVAAAQSVSKTWVSYFDDLDLLKKLCLRKFKQQTEFR